MSDNAMLLLRRRTVGSGRRWVSNSVLVFCFRMLVPYSPCPSAIAYSRCSIRHHPFYREVSPQNADSEMTRLQILGNPDLLRQIRQVRPFRFSPLRVDLLTLQQTQPELAEAAEHSPARFAALFRQLQERQRDAELARQREIEALNADPFGVEAQTRIEEAIRQQAIMENLEHALEYSPEAFGRVAML